MYMPVATLVDRSSAAGLGLRGRLRLARPAAGPLARHHYPVQKQFAAPDAPRLTALERAGQAGDPHLAATAERLGPLDVHRGFGEEQFRVVGAGQVHRARHLRDAQQVNATRDPGAAGPPPRVLPPLPAHLIPPAPAPGRSSLEPRPAPPPG